MRTTNSATLLLLPIALLATNCGDGESLEDNVIASAGSSGTANAGNGNGNGSGNGGNTNAMDGGVGGMNTMPPPQAGNTATAGTGGMGGTAGTAGTGGMGGMGGMNAAGMMANAGMGGAPPPREYTIEGCSAPEGNGGDLDGGVADGGVADPGGGADASVTDSAGGGVATFTIYDSITDDPIDTCEDRTGHFSITITGSAPLTIVANVASDIDPGSVVFTYDGVEQSVHSLFPYAIAPDDNGDFEEANPTLTPGTHAISVTVYEEAGAMGAVLGEADFTFTVVDGG